MKLWCGLLVVLVGPASARAAGPVLVRTHTALPTAKARAQASRLQQRLARQLGARVRQGAALVTAARRGLGRAARPLTAVRHGQLVAAVKTGAEHGYAGDWQRAVSALQSARLGLMGDVLSLARQRRLLRTLQRARLLLALCYLRLKQPRRAWSMMEEALRTQPDLSPSGALYGPALQRLYYRVKAQLDLQKARLRVVTTPPGALIFLNGRSIGFSPVTVDGLYPGPYDLLVVKGKQHSRIRRIRLGATETRQRVDLGLEQTVSLGRRLGLRARAGARGRRAVVGRALGLGRLLGARQVLLVGVHVLSSGPALMGRLVDCRQGRVLRAAYLSLLDGEPRPGGMRRLARYLLEGGEPGRGVRRAPITRPLRRGRPVAHPHQAPKPSRGARAVTGLGVAGWILLGVGLAGGGAGAVLWGIDGKTRVGSARAADRYNTDRVGVVALSVGVGVAVLGAVLLIVDAVKQRRSEARRERARLRPVLGPAPGGWRVGLRGRF